MLPVSKKNIDRKGHIAGKSWKWKEIPMVKMEINGIEIKHLLTMSLQNRHKQQVKNGKRES